MAQQWLTLPQAAASLGVSVRTLERRIARGLIESRRLPDGRREVAVNASDTVADNAAGAAPGAVRPVAPQEHAAPVAATQDGSPVESYDRQLSAARTDLLIARRTMRQAWAISTVSMVIAALAVTWAVRTTSQPAAVARSSDHVSDMRRMVAARGVADTSEPLPVVSDAGRVCDTTPKASDAAFARAMASRSVGPEVATSQTVSSGSPGAAPATSSTDPASAATAGPTAASATPASVTNRPPVVADSGTEATDTATKSPLASLDPSPPQATGKPLSPPADRQVGQSDRQPVAADLSPCLPSQRLVRQLSLTDEQIAEVARLDAHFNTLYNQYMSDSDRQMRETSQAMADAQAAGRLREAEDTQVRLSGMLLERREVRRQLDAQYVDAVLPLLNPSQAAKLKPPTP
ncbi:MAG: hypothetical protein GXY74_00720 [Phycisphaerae bacterium]|nr:hypothetical protein [Phycisphaerae bacterium]